LAEHDNDFLHKELILTEDINSFLK